MKYIQYIFFLPALLLMAACSSSDDFIETGEFVSVSFNMVTNGSLSGSRADDKGHSETTSEYRSFEDGIDMEDFGMFIFVKLAGSPDEEKLLYRLSNLLSTDDARVNINGSEGNYFVDLMIRKDDLKDMLGREITVNGQSIINFRILIMANCASSTMNGSTMWNAIDGQTFSAVITQLAEWSFPMSDIYNAGGGPDVETIYPNPDKKSCIPMFGTNVFAVTELSLLNSRPVDRIYLGEVNLLRSVAKVRVVDNIQNKNAGGYPRVVAAELLSSQNQIRPLPAGALNYEDGQQVHTPNIFQENNNLTLAATYKLGTISEAFTITPVSQRTGNVFIGFVPEQGIGHPNNNFEAGMPVFHITIDNQKADGTIESLEYNVPMTSYNGVKFSFGQNILRNHIYTLSVNDFGATLDIKVDVVPYRSCVLEPFFGL